MWQTVRPSDLQLNISGTTATVTSTVNIPSTIGTIYANPYPTYIMLGPVVMNDLTKPVFSIDLSEVEDMWRVRYGAQWVRASEVQHDEFYNGAAKRLLVAGRLESHILGDTHEQVFKLLEK